MVPLSAGLRVQDALEFVARRHRIPVYYESFILRVVAADQARLGLPTRELPSALLVAPLNLDTVELVRKAFADSPQGGIGGDSSSSTSILPRQQQRSGDSGLRGGSSDEGEMFGPTASRRGERSPIGAPVVPSSASSAAGSRAQAVSTAYQEWPVVKTNHRGRRQERILGVDLKCISNKKVDKQRFIASDKPTTSERLVADLWLVEISDSDPTVFAMTFKSLDGGAEQLVRVLYQAGSATDRDSIIAKLTTILDINGDMHKLRRTS